MNLNAAHPLRCSNPNNRTPLSSGFASIASSWEFADALLRTCALSLAATPQDAAFAINVFPNVIVIERNVSMQVS